MHNYTPEAAAVIESRERRFAHRLFVDWNDNGKFDHPLSDLSDYVTDTGRDQTLTSTAPDEVMLVEGYAAAKLQATVTGDYNGLSLAAHFAPYNGRSVFYTTGVTLGVQVAYAINVVLPSGKWETFRQFVGIVRDVTTDRESGSVVVDCLDNAELMRTNTRVPAYAMLTRYLVDGYKRAQLVDSSSVIDLAARSAGFSAGPRGYDRYRGLDAARQCVLSVPFHGSLLPEIGSMDNVEEFHLTEDWEKDAALKPRAEQYRDGPHGYLALNAVPRGKNQWAIKKYWAETAGLYPSDRRLWGTTTLAAWVYWTGNNVDESTTLIEMFDADTTVQLIVEGSNGGVNARTVGPNNVITDGYWLFLGSPGWHFVEVAFDLYPGRDTKYRTRVDDQVSPVTSRTYRAPNGGPDHPWQNLVTVTNKYAVSDVQIMRSYYADDLANITYDAVLYSNARVSWGRNRITYTLRDSGREAWELAKEVASAEYGAVFFDEYGTFVSWNYDDVTSRQGKTVRTFTVDDLESLAFRTTMDSVRNVWRATTKTGRSESGIAYDLARDDVLYWQRTDTGEYFPSTMIMQPGTEWSGWFPNKPEIMSVHPSSAPLLAELADFTEHAPYQGYKTYQGTTYVGLALTITARNTSRDWSNVRIWNGNNGAVGFVGPNNIERFRLRGTLVREEVPRSWEIRSADSVADYGERVLELDDNFWLQDEFQTRAMLRKIVDRIARPIPVSESITVPGDPRVQIGDTIEVRDLDGFGESMWLQVLGIKREFGTEGLSDTYTVEMVKSPGVGVWDSPTYGLWDQSLIWS